MTLAYIVAEAQIFLLILVRVIAFIELAPVLSSSAVPQIGKIGLAAFTAAAVLPWVVKSGLYVIPETGGAFVFMLLGEVFIGIIFGFFLIIITSVFQLAGQFFSTQMGFASSQVFDPMAQVQIPLMGQFFNLTSMLILLSINGFQKMFLGAVYTGFKVLNISQLLVNKDNIIMMLLKSLSGLFVQALVIAMPIMGTLLLMQVTMGLLAKAAPQMNLLMLSFPMNIFISFLVLFAAMPFIIESFEAILDAGFEGVNQMMKTAIGVSG